MNRNTLIAGLFLSLVLSTFGVLMESSAPSGLSVEFVGAAPKFRVYRNTDPGSSFLITMGSVVEQEVHPTGPPNRITGLASDPDLVFSPPTQRQINTTAGKATVYAVEFSGYSTEMPSTWIDILTYITESSIRIPYGNDTILVPEYSFKWSINITGWPFKSPNNTLALTIGLTTAGDDVAASGGGSTNVSLGTTQFIINTPDYAFDGNRRVPVGIQQSGNNMVFTFPSFQSLYYDPVVSGSTYLPTSGIVAKQEFGKTTITIFVLFVAFLFTVF